MSGNLFIGAACAAVLCTGALCDTARAGDGDLGPPTRLTAGDQLIDTDIGHAAPYVADIDGDGKRDLLVGQFGEGKLKICKNIGTSAEPKYAAPVWFEAGGAVAKVPTG